MREVRNQQVHGVVGRALGFELSRNRAGRYRHPVAALDQGGSDQIHSAEVSGQPCNNRIVGPEPSNWTERVTEPFSTEIRFISRRYSN